MEIILLFPAIIVRITSMVSAIRAITLLVLIGLTVQINYVAVCCALFEMNRKAIAETSCEKKTPHCNGHCFLKKQVAAAEEEQPATAEKRSPNKTTDRLPEPMQGLEPSGLRPGLVQPYCSGNIVAAASLPIDGHTHEVYHPPDFMVFMNAG
jgi:hypothetical protein